MQYFTLKSLLIVLHRIYSSLELSCLEKIRDRNFAYVVNAVQLFVGTNDSTRHVMVYH